MTYADVYRLTYLLDEQMQRLLDGDAVNAEALGEAYNIAVKLTAAMARAWVAGEKWVPDGCGGGRMETMPVADTKYQIVQRALDECGGCAIRAAAKVGLDDSTLRRWKARGLITY